MKKAIIVIPGVCCSTLVNKNEENIWIVDNQLDGEKQLEVFSDGSLSCSKDGKSKNRVKAQQGEEVYGILDICKPFVTALREEFKDQYDVIYKQYDWRLDNLNAIKEVKEIVDGYDKVILIGHSMGGVIINKFIETYGHKKVEKIITLGTPYVGSVCVAKVIYDGDLSVLTDALSNPVNKTIESNFSNYTSFYELLPNPVYLDKEKWLITNDQKLDKWYKYIWSRPEDKLNDKKATEKVLKKQLNEILLEKAEKFQKSTLESDMVNKHLDYTIFAGDGLYTIETMKYVNNGEIRFAIPNYSKKGDGTVSIFSATRANQVQWVRREGVNHINLLFDQETLSQVVQVLKGEKVTKVENYKYNPHSAIIETGFKNKMTFAGDCDLEVLQDNVIIGKIHKEKIADSIFYRINCEGDIKINNIGTVKGERAFVVYYNEKSYQFKVISDKEQTIDIALGSDKKIYALDNIKLGANDEFLVDYVEGEVKQAAKRSNSDSKLVSSFSAKIIEM